VKSHQMRIFFAKIIKFSQFSFSVNSSGDARKIDIKIASLALNP